MSWLQQAFIHFYHRGFTYLAILTLPITALLMMWLAVSKQVQILDSHVSTG